MKLNTRRNLISAAFTSAALLMSGGAYAADSHVLTVNATVAGNCKFVAGTSNLAMSLDPSATTVATGNAVVKYRCTKGTTPGFTYLSGSTANAAGGNLVDPAPGGGSIPYTFSGSAPVAGTGLQAIGANEKDLTVTVSVDQNDAADVAAAVYSDTITISMTP